MIPRERDERMLVTMTAGELYALVSEAAERAAEKAVGDILCHLAERDGEPQESEVLVGGDAIAKAIHVDRSTMYRLRREGVLGDAVRQMGSGKLIAFRSELLNAIKENQAQ
jgi:hypothetical protein